MMNAPTGLYMAEILQGNEVLSPSLGIILSVPAVLPVAVSSRYHG
jgi:hypothetical protein